MSTQVVPEFKWRLSLLGLALTLTIGAGLSWAIAHGAADPPRAPRLVLNENRGDRLVPAGAFSGVRLYRLVDAPAQEQLPLTIEVEAINEGDPRSAWGVWISTVGAQAGEAVPFLVTDQGYVLSALNSTTLQHEQFMHLTAVENRLTLHIDVDGTLTFRANDEVYRTMELSLGLPVEYGVALLGDVRLTSFNLRVYAADER